MSRADARRSLIRRFLIGRFLIGRSLIRRSQVRKGDMIIMSRSDAASLEQTAGGASNAQLVTLWRRAWEMSRPACAYSLGRLRRGDGGFYGPDDLQQDLFCEFWRLYLRWKADARSHGLTPDERLLWEAWQKRLSRGGWRVLRRKPQRLWDRAERSAETDEIERISQEAGQAEQTAEEIVLVGELRAHQLRRLESALWRLRPLQRQALYMRYWRGIREAEIARHWRLSSKRAIEGRVFRAKRQLRKWLGDKEICG